MKNRANRSPNVHAIFPVLNDADLFTAAIKPIYDFVSGITVVTSYDRDWEGRPIRPDQLVPRILERSIDPQRKVNLLIGQETNQARSINRAMEYVNPSRKSRRTIVQNPQDRPPEKVDYFWIIDSDEIYEQRVIPALLEYVMKHGKPVYQVAAFHYFKHWNFRVDQMEWFTAFVRSDRRLGAQRNQYPSFTSKIAARVPGISSNMRQAMTGTWRIRSDVGFFHHGSYVGPRTRIAAKLRSSPHNHQFIQDWLSDRWDRFSLGDKDFHPTQPSSFGSATYVSTAQLPAEVRSHEWPAGYLEE